MAWVLALWYMYILRGFCLMTLGLQLVMIIGIPSWSLIPSTIVDLSTSVWLVVKNKSKVELERTARTGHTSGRADRIG